ncbi:MAG: transglutaminase-like domain-containing protein, partial [Methanobrevibacter sp.]|nr:transglutaminase-like domain-containing protein [Methanobrevibacter sp.]
SSSSSSSGSSFTVKDIEAAASNVEAYVNKNKVLPKTVTVGSTSVSIDEFSYLMAQAISELNKGSSASIAHKSLSSNNPVNYTLSATIYEAQYVKTANEILTFVSSNKYMPNYATVYSTSGSSAGKAGFNLYTFCFAKILDFYKSEGYLPKYCTFDSSVFASSSSGSSSPSTSANGTVTTANSSQYKAGLNVKSSEGNLDQYLVSSGFATITTAIKNKAASLTKGLTTNAAKATAIFNFVRDNIAYSYYANSKKGADGTLSAGSANCCDQANLVVALCRAAGIPARYSHAQGCTFSSGLVTGHVWAQIYIGGTWYSADATSTRNSLGNIKNWNTNSYYSLKNYATIPF